jgi:hypothetical protein
MLQQGAGSSGASVRCLNATSELVGGILGKDGDEPVVRNLSETQLTTSHLGSNAADIPLQVAYLLKGGRDR